MVHNVVKSPSLHCAQWLWCLVPWSQPRCLEGTRGFCRGLQGRDLPQAKHGPEAGEVEGGGCEAPERRFQQPESPTAIATVLNYLSNHFRN